MRGKRTSLPGAKATVHIYINANTVCNSSDKSQSWSAFQTILKRQISLSVRVAFDPR